MSELLVVHNRKIHVKEKIPIAKKLRKLLFFSGVCRVNVSVFLSDLMGIPPLTWMEAGTISSD